MSVAPSPTRPTHSQQPETPGLAAICRARRIVTTLGGRFSLELGIDLDRNPEEVERWGLAATLLRPEVPTAIATRTFRALARAGAPTIQAAGACDRKALASLLDKSGYSQSDDGVASRLAALARALADRYDGRLATLGERVVQPTELRERLELLPGWTSSTVRTFLRELRGIWPGAVVVLDPRAAAAARHLKLPSELRGLLSVAEAAHLDVRDLEAALLRLFLSHDLAGCPGGEECPCAAFSHDQFVHF